MDLGSLIKELTELANQFMADGTDPADVEVVEYESAGRVTNVLIADGKVYIEHGYEE